MKRPAVVTLSVRLPKRLHRLLAERAKAEGLSLNASVIVQLSALNATVTSSRHPLVAEALGYAAKTGRTDTINTTMTDFGSTPSLEK